MTELPRYSKKVPSWKRRRTGHRSKHTSQPWTQISLQRNYIGRALSPAVRDTVMRTWTAACQNPTAPTSCGGRKTSTRPSDTPCSSNPISRRKQRKSTGGAMTSRSLKTSRWVDTSAHHTSVSTILWITEL